MRDERVRKGSGEEAVEATESASPTSSPPPVPSVDPAPQGEGEEEKLEAELKDLVSGLERERDEYLALARRTKADFENYRKRVSREASEAEARGRASLGSDLLSVVDNLERALAAMEGAQDQFVEGVRLVYEELSRALANAGIESFSPTGEQFDPDLHEAMLAKPGTQGQVLEVFQKGYRVNGQVLRPARVAVGAGEES
jgi:molecular chaperone GrpE